MLEIAKILGVLQCVCVGGGGGGGGVEGVLICLGATQSTYNEAVVDGVARKAPKAKSAECLGGCIF